MMQGGAREISFVKGAPTLGVMVFSPECQFNGFYAFSK